jgi:predicted phosphodiesterase
MAEAKHDICQIKGCDRPVSGGRKSYCSPEHMKKASNDRRQARADLATNSGVDSSRLEKLGRVAELLESNGVDIDEIGSVTGFRVKKWQAVAKGRAIKDPKSGRVITQEPSKVVDLESVSVLVSPEWAEGPRWELPHPPAPVKLDVPKGRGPTLLKGWKTAVLLPDPQFGFRRDLYDASKMDPFHDDRALDVALQVLDAERPDLTIFLGDVLDFASFGKYRQEAAFALTVQPTLEAAYRFVASAAAYSDSARFIEGNHDVRLANDIVDNAKHAFGLKRAGAPPEEWPVMSVPFLLNLPDLGVEYVGGYPAGATYINDNLAAIHGRKVGNDRRSAATMVVEDERVSVVFGHVHRIETTYRTRNTRGRPVLSVAHTPGCLCRIDGAVPSVKSGTDAFGRSITSWENWQQGVTVVRYQEGDGRFKLEPVEIIEGSAIHRQQEFTSRVTPEWAA